MAQLGGLLVILGLGSLVLPLLNMEFTIVRPLEDYQPWAGIGLAVIGALILAWPMIRARRGGGGGAGPAA